MPFSHGSKAVFKIQNAASVLTDISAYLSGVSDSFEIDTNEVTTYGNTTKVYITGLKDAKFSIEGNFEPVVDALLNGIIGMSRTFEYLPQGSTGGLPKYTGSLVLTSYQIETPVDDKAGFSAEFQAAADVTRGTV